MSDIHITDEYADSESFEEMWKDQPPVTSHRFRTISVEIPEGLTPEEIIDMAFDHIERVMKDHP